MAELKIALATGGTGGHIFPAQALAKRLRERGMEPVLITDRRGGDYDGALEGAEVHIVRSAALSGRNPLDVIRAVLQLMTGYFQARALLRRLRPAAVVGFGGYPSAPTILAAACLGVPTVIHEQNAVLGRANRFLARWVRHIALSFEDTRGLRAADRRKAVRTGAPVRPEFAALHNRRAAADTAAAGNSANRLHLLIVGGSQGAAIFGEVIPAAILALPQRLRARLQICQQVRAAQLPQVREIYQKAGMTVELASFFTDMPKKAAAADLLICRAGASTIAELTVAGKPAILIPYPYAVDNHQAANAARLCDAGGGWMIEQSRLNAEMLAAQLTELLDAPDRLAAAARAVATLAMPEADRLLADIVCKAAGEPS